MSYLDTCYLIAFIDKKDDVRRHENREIGRALSGNKRERYKIGIPVIGEAFSIINMKCQKDIKRKRDAFKTLENMLDECVLEIVGLGSTSDAFIYARDLMEICTDGYANSALTPMDALITADALIDNECQTIYTKDSNLLMNVELRDKVNEIRENIDASYPKLNFLSFKY